MKNKVRFLEFIAHIMVSYPDLYRVTGIRQLLHLYDTEYSKYIGAE